jgi:hypothetical protein
MSCHRMISLMARAIKCLTGERITHRFVC